MKYYKNVIQLTFLSEFNHLALTFSSHVPGFNSSQIWDNSDSNPGHTAERLVSVDRADTLQWNLLQLGYLIARKLAKVLETKF